MSDETEETTPHDAMLTQAAEAWSTAAQAASVVAEDATRIADESRAEAESVAVTQRELDALVARARDLAGPTVINISVSGAAFVDIDSWRIVVDGTMHSVRMESRGPGCVIAQVDDHESAAEDEANAVKMLVRSLCEAGRVVSGVAAVGVVMK